MYVFKISVAYELSLLLFLTSRSLHPKEVELLTNFHCEGFQTNSAVTNLLFKMHLSFPKFDLTFGLLHFPHMECFFMWRKTKKILLIFYFENFEIGLNTILQ
jgi:hypothetical protein